MKLSNTSEIPHWAGALLNVPGVPLQCELGVEPKDL